MHSNLFMYLTAMSAVSIHNLVNNINEATGSLNQITSRTLDTDWTLSEHLDRRFSQCNGTRQSPINIETDKVKENLNLRLGLTAYDKPISGFIMNQFPTFKLLPYSFKWPKPNALVSSTLARSFDSSSENQYTLSYIQFFWSQDDQHNLSVHKVEGDSYPAEIHFIHFNTAYSTIDEASSKLDGLLIFAALVIPSTHESYIFDRIIEEQLNITNHGEQVLFDEDSTWRSLLPVDTSRFYRYRGSTLLPPCQETVQWIVFEEKLKLGHKQLKRLRRHRYVGKNLITGKEIDWSSQRRPTQQVFDRTVERSFSLRADTLSLCRQVGD